jgi:hypothetical protein
LKLEHINSIEEFRASVRVISDADLLAQIIGLEFAVDVMGFVIREGATYEKARQTRDGLLEQRSAVIAECYRRHIPTGDT